MKTVTLTKRQASEAINEYLTRRGKTPDRKRGVKLQQASHPDNVKFVVNVR